MFVGLHRGFGDTFAMQLDSAVDGLRATSSHYELDLDALVKIHVWLRDVSDLPDMEKRFTRYFKEGAYPARMTSTTGFIDEDCLVTLEGIAYGGTPENR